MWDSARDGFSIAVCLQAFGDAAYAALSRMAPKSLDIDRKEYVRVKGFHPKKQAFSVATFSSLGTIEVKTFSGDGDTPTRTASIVGRAMERAHGWQTSVNLNE